MKWSDGRRGGRRRRPAAAADKFLETGKPKGHAGILRPELSQSKAQLLILSFTNSIISLGMLNLDSIAEP
jgi:hypothetical protein